MKTKSDLHPFVLFHQELAIDCSKIQIQSQESAITLQEYISKRQVLISKVVMQINNISEMKQFSNQNIETLTNVYDNQPIFKSELLIKFEQLEIQKIDSQTNQIKDKNTKINELMDNYELLEQKLQELLQNKHEQNWNALNTQEDLQSIAKVEKEPENVQTQDEHINDYIKDKDQELQQIIQEVQENVIEI
ncbi:hypothetical protein SS50377_21257 [Spironucleus salmonicida]|uniref:Uncharacterized protein n=1 Tax=Spironucleus salmonicida TaxID=348837 RepID=V6LI83_9EUKA|nr:hypothetical protein SS50377_21257 [Spironucleus salmonicida]|eukprot:EST44028.1 Hypothetical protein SS50377_16337 [Spironucleus salmonicida]